MYEEITLLEQKGCEASYGYKGCVFRYWIITGGTQALSFDDFSFTERFNKWPDYVQGVAGCPQNLKELESGSLKGGEVLIDFFNRNNPKRLLRRHRRSLLTRGNTSRKLTSKRLHDTTECCYVRATYTLNEAYINPVVTSGTRYSTPSVPDFAPPEWRHLGDVTESLKFKNLEDLSVEEFVILQAAVDNVRGG